MPNEMISQPGEPFEVRVAWGSGQNEVQVASLCEGVPTGAQRIVRYVNEWLEAAGMADRQIDYDELAKGFPQLYFDGWHVGLRDRRKVNDLIRLLQRARDSAFGKDA